MVDTAAIDFVNNTFIIPAWTWLNISFFGIPLYDYCFALALSSFAAKWALRRLNSQGYHNDNTFDFLNSAYEKDLNDIEKGVFEGVDSTWNEMGYRNFDTDVYPDYSNPDPELVNRLSGGFDPFKNRSGQLSIQADKWDLEDGW